MSPELVAAIFAGIVSVLTAFTVMITAFKTNAKVEKVHVLANNNFTDVKNDLKASRRDVDLLKDRLGIPAGTSATSGLDDVPGEPTEVTIVNPAPVPVREVGSDEPVAGGDVDGLGGGAGP